MKPQVHRLIVPRSVRYLTSGSLRETIDEVWFLCHGYGQLAEEFLNLASTLNGERRLLVAPEGMSRFYKDDYKSVGASWMTREDRDFEIRDYVSLFDLVCQQIFETVDQDKVRLGLVGFSQGVATAVRWALHGQARVERLVLWGASLPPELNHGKSLNRMRTMDLTLVRGRYDKLFPKNVYDEDCNHLREHGVSFSELTFEGGHRIDNETMQRLVDKWSNLPNSDV